MLIEKKEGGGGGVMINLNIRVLVMYSGKNNACKVLILTITSFKNKIDNPDYTTFNNLSNQLQKTHLTVLFIKLFIK